MWIMLFDLVHNSIFQSLYGLEIVQYLSPGENTFSIGPLGWATLKLWTMMNQKTGQLLIWWMKQSQFPKHHSFWELGQQT